MVKKQFIIKGKHSRVIALDVTYKADRTSKPVVVLVHGFKGFKDWGHFNHLADLMAQNGFVFVKFNFSHNGTTPEHLTEFTDLEAFGNNNYGIELDDLDEVLNWICSENDLSAELDIQNIQLIGHSRGGAIGILNASNDQRITKIVTWAAVADLVQRHSAKTIDAWKRVGVVYAQNARTKQQMPLYKQFYEYILQHADALNVKLAAQRITVPFLIIHGTADDAVPFEDAEDLKQYSNSAILSLIKDADHTFGVKHPFEGHLPLHARDVVEQTIEFLKA
jgi:uncharacterized protein